MFRFAFSDKSIVMVTEGLGPQPFHGRIVLLVNQHTASAAETITGFARENKLAIIVGTKTAGQVLGRNGIQSWPRIRTPNPRHDFSHVERRLP